MADRYPKAEALESVRHLSQREIDVLDEARRLLNWRTILSLAHKYYPECRSPSVWQEAIRRTRVLANRFNIVYLIKMVRQVAFEFAQSAVQAAKAASSRLFSSSFLGKKKGDTRLGVVKGVWDFWGSVRGKLARGEPIQPRVAAAFREWQAAGVE